MTLNDKVYNILKWVALIALPATAVCVKAVFPIWGLPYADAIATTLTAIGTLIGTLIGISTIGYVANTNTTDADSEESVEEVEDVEVKG